MSLRTHDFESCASASSATSAEGGRKTGGPEGGRTPGLHNAIVALSQLSYRPEFQFLIREKCQFKRNE